MYLQIDRQYLCDSTVKVYLGYVGFTSVLGSFHLPSGGKFRSECSTESGSMISLTETKEALNIIIIIDKKNNDDLKIVGER